MKLLAIRTITRVAILAPILFVLLSLHFPPAPPAYAQATGCQYVLGFDALHDLIPTVVGPCAGNQTHNPVTGDGLQQTANGLMVWRKSDNWTAFTNGFQTWVNGPFGLEMRLNGQRFSWEQNPEMLPVIPAPSPGERCHTAGLSARLEGVDAGAGNFYGTFVLTNNLSVSCTLFGFPGAQMLDARYNPLPTRVVRDGGYFPIFAGPSLVTVPAGGTATFVMHWEDVPVGNEQNCPTSSFLQVTPPDEFDPLVLPTRIMACGGGELDVSAVQPVP